MAFLSNRHDYLIITSNYIMNDITVIFNNYLEHYGSVDIAESEFKKMLHEDPELHAMYKDWCETVGSSEKCGFADYAEEYMRSQDDVWQSLADYDDDRD